MKKLSLKPDADMAWIYENNHPDYNSARARYLREARSSAIRFAPQWMIEDARINDLLDDLRKRKDEKLPQSP